MKPGSIVSYTFKQQNAAVYLGLGFLPDWVRIWNISDGEDMVAWWSVNFRALACIEGYSMVGDDASAIAKYDYAYGEGIALYRGGTVIGTGTTPSTTTYLAPDTDPDKRDANTAADALTTWTLDTSGDRTGHWNAECNTTYVGVGSRICVDGKWATVVALTSNGDQDDEVTLNEALDSGTIEFITSPYDLVAQSANTVAKEGIVISDTSYLLNATTDTMVIEAGQYR